MPAPVPAPAQAPSLPTPSIRRPRDAAPARDGSDASAPAPPRRDGSSLLYARIAGARAVLGDASAHDDALLLAANAVHLRANANPSDEEAQAASAALWRAEADAWAAANGASPRLTEEDVLAAYLDLWSLVLDPPATPDFMDRREITKRYLLERTAAGLSIAIQETPSRQPVPVDTLLDHYMDDAEVLSRYYLQFAGYAATQLNRFSRLGVIGEAARQGLNRLRLAETPKRMWHISSLAKIPPGALNLPSGMLLSTVMRRMGDSHVAQMDDGAFYHIDANGTIERLSGPILDGEGRLDVRQVLKSRGIIAAPARDRSAGPVDYGLQEAPAYIANWSACDPVPLFDHAVARRQDALRSAIDEWKKEKYLPSRMESVMRLLIPFYELYHNKRWDPGYHVKAQDVAWDAGLLAFTVASIAIGGLGGSAGMAAARQSMRAVASQGLKAMIQAGLASTVRQFSLRAFLILGVRETADFVLPLTPVVHLMKGVTRSTAIAARALRPALRDASILLRAASPKDLLNVVYDAIAKTGGLARSISAQTLRDAIEVAARRPVPDRVYREQSHAPLSTLEFSSGDAASEDDILVECIRAAASTMDRAPARLLSADRGAALSGAAPQPRASTITAIDTTQAPGRFRTIQDVLINEGPRLVGDGKLRAETLRAAIFQAYTRDDKRIVYLGGSIPQGWIVPVEPALREPAPQP